MRKRFAVLAVAMLGVLASVTAAQAGTTTITNTSNPVNFLSFVPCANGGAGEIVSFSGDLHSVVKLTINGNRVNLHIHQNYQGVTGTGQTTGDTYVTNGTLNESFNDSLTNGQANETVTEHVNYNGQGSAPNLTFHELVHVTVNANGDVTVSTTTISIECG